MAGHYFYDPRPFYGFNMSSNLMPLDELFHKYEPMPYWMDQRMVPMSYADYHSKQVMTRGPEVPQFLPYNNMRPELATRDDIYADAYKRAPHFGAGFEVPYPDQRRQTSKDDSYLHTMMSPAAPHSQFGPHRGYGAIPTMPVGYNQRPDDQPGHMNNQRYEQTDVTRNSNHGGSNNNNNKSYNNNNNNNSSNDDDRYGTKSSKKTSYSNNKDDDEYSNKGSNSRSKQDGDYGYGSKSTSNSKSSKQEMHNDDYGYGTKSTKSKQDDYGYGNKSSTKQDVDVYGNSVKNSSKKSNGESYSNKSNGNSSYKQKQYNDSSSDDDEDVKWGTKPLLKQSSKGDTYSHGKKSGSSKGSGGHGYSNSSNNMVVYDCGKKHIHDSSSDEDESYSYTKKASKAGKQYNQGVTKVQQHSHGLGHGHSQAQQQPKQPVFLSQCKSLELKVPICCDNCERKVTACLQHVDGVESVLCDQWEKKVIVYGNVKPDVVLKRVRRVKKSAELWQQAPNRVWVY